MKIPAINTVRFNYSNFEGKKNKQHNVSVPNTLKAVPVAVLLAMSPMVTQAQTQKELTPQESKELIKSGKVVNRYNFKNASSQYGDCEIKCFDNDNNSKTIEFAELHFATSPGSNFYAADIYPTKLIEDKNGFWVKGNGDRYFVNTDLNITEIKFNERVAIPVTEQFFNVLLDVYKNDLPVIRNKDIIYPL